MGHFLPKTCMSCLGENKPAPPLSLSLFSLSLSLSSPQQHQVSLSSATHPQTQGHVMKWTLGRLLDKG